jgi:hypothetical protein
VWRVVIAGKATLQEIESHWSIVDLCVCHCVLDMAEDVDRLQAEKVRRR